MNRFEAPKSSTPLPRFMNTRLTAVNCPHCANAFEAGAQRTFLGFQKFSCPSCLQGFKGPLTPRRRILYWSLLAVAAVATWQWPPATGARPSIFAILMAIAVLADLAMLIKRRRA